jgi:tetratricopeptide (TPR) repeat protein
MSTVVLGDGSRSGRSAEEWFDRGVAFERSDQLVDAVQAYQAAVGARSDFPEAWFNLGNLLRDAGLLDDAERAFRTALRHRPRLAEGWYNLADLLQEQGEREAAITSLQLAVTADPDYADAHYNLALCLHWAGRPAEARPHWRRYLELDDRGAWAETARRHLAGSENIL